MLLATKLLKQYEEIQPHGVDFDGANDYLVKSSDFTANADGKTVTFSGWVWIGDTAASSIYNAVLSEGGATSGFYVGVSSGQLFITARNAAGAQILLVSGTSYIAYHNWNHILISIDLANASNRSVYINDIQASITWTTYTNDSIDFTRTEHKIGTAIDGTKKAQRLAHIYLDYTYRDMSVTANRRLFRTSRGLPAPNQAGLNPILYLPMDNYTNAHVNYGTGGNMTLTGVVSRSGRGANQYNEAMSTFDGATQYLSKASVPAGLVDGGIFSISLSINPSQVASAVSIFSCASAVTNRFQLSVTAGGQIKIEGWDSTPTKILDAVTSGTALVSGRRYTINICIDLSDTGKRHIIINGSAATVTWITYTAGNIDFSMATPGFYIARDISGLIGYFNGSIGSFWFDTTYVDFSSAAVIGRFYSNNTPVYIGQNGEIPTSSSPILYFKMHSANSGYNFGTGGDFTANAAPYTGARSLSEFLGNRATFNGTTANISKTSQLTGAADGKVFLLSFFVKKTGSVLYTITDTTGATFRVTINASDQLVIVAKNSAAATILSATVTTTIANATDTHVLVSIDLANSANRAVYLNDVAAAVTWTTYTNDSIDFTVADFYVGSETGGGNKFAGTLSEFMLFYLSAYVDISDELTRLKFRNPFGFPVDVRTDGRGAIGYLPIAYLRFDPASFGANSGTGGALTASNITDGGQL